MTSGWHTGPKAKSFTKYNDSACSVWQCSSWGKVSGISGRVDINLQLKSKAAMDKYMKGAYMNTRVR